jgi:hypothetical protein
MELSDFMFHERHYFAASDRELALVPREGDEGTSIVA